MKNKHWLIYIVIFLAIINIGYFVSLKYFHADSYIKSRIISYIGEKTNLKINYDSIFINDKEISVSNLKLAGKNFTLKTIQLDFQYNLWNLIFHKNNKSLLSNIHFYMPELDYHIFPKKQSKKKEFPNLKKYFSKLQILNAKINISYQSGDFFYNENFKNILLDVSNDKFTNIELSGNSENKGKITLKAKLNYSNLESLFVKIVGYKLGKEQTNLVDNLSINSNISYQKNNYRVFIENFAIQYKKHYLNLKSSNFHGNLSKVKFNLKNLFVDSHRIILKGNIFDLNENPKAKISFSVNNLKTEKYYEKLNSNFNIVGKISGELKNPIVSGKITSNSIKYQDYCLKNNFLNFKYYNKHLSFNLKKATFLSNTITGTGKYYNGKFTASANCDSFYFSRNNIIVDSKISAKVSNKNGLKMKISLKDINLKYKELNLSNLQSTIDLEKTLLTINLSNHGKSFIFNASKNLRSNEEKATLSFKRYDLNLITSNLARFKNFNMPSLSGKISYYRKKNTLISSKMNLRIYDTEYGRFDGKFEGIFVKDYLHKKNYFKLSSHSAKFNYEPFSINLMAGGDFNNFKTYYFRINNDINLQGNFSLKPKISYKITAKGKNIKITDIAKYFVKNYSSKEIGGKLNFNLTYSSESSSPLFGNIDVSNFFYNSEKTYNSHLDFFSKNERIEIHNSKIFTDKNKICDINGYFIPKTKLYQTKINFLKNKISDIFPNSKFDGISSGKLDINGIGKKYQLIADFESYKIKIDKTKIDSIKLKFIQTNDKLNLKYLSVKNKDIKINGSGKIGYNLLNKSLHPSKDNIFLEASGDFLKLLSSEIKIFDYAKSNSYANMTLMIDENGFYIKDGKFTINKGIVHLKDQTENARKIELKSYFKNNLFHLDYCKFYIGQGWFKMHNKIFDNEDDFKIGEINLGQYFFKTSNSGLLIYVNGYMPNKSLINVSISGIDSNFSTIQGPFDNIKIKTVVEFSNGKAIFPPYTKNILKLLTSNDKKIKKKDYNELPLDLDLILKFNDNIKYVTYPLDISIEPKSYLHFKYKNGNFRVIDAKITSEKGKLEMFGTNFETREIKFLMNPYMDEPIIYGSFTKKVGDGSLVILDISSIEKTNDKSKRTFGNLQMTLSSDNPNDNSPEKILAKLRYNKSYDDLSTTERKNIYQDEALDWAGVGFSNYLIDPLISPIENYIRKLFDLDTFYLKTDIFKNIFYQNIDNSNNPNNQKSNLISDLGVNYFLNDLSINAGKYIYQDIFLDYELNFEKSNNLENKSKIDLYHNFIVRIDLPWEIKLSYKYYIKPKNEKNSQELMLNRSFRF